MKMGLESWYGGAMEEGCSWDRSNDLEGPRRNGTSRQKTVLSQPHSLCETDDVHHDDENLHLQMEFSPHMHMATADSGADISKIHPKTMATMETMTDTMVVMSQSRADCTSSDQKGKILMQEPVAMATTVTLDSMSGSVTKTVLSGETIRSEPLVKVSNTMGATNSASEAKTLLVKPKQGPRNALRSEQKKSQQADHNIATTQS